MAHFFPAASRMDVERPPSLRRTPTGDDATAEGRQTRPSHINWLQSSLAASSSQAGITMPKRPPNARLGRSASLSAIPAPSPIRRQSSSISNHSLQLDRLAGCQTDGPAKPLSPISEQSYVPTPTSRRDLYTTDVEPGTPVSIASTSYSAFLRRPLKRSISATSTSSLRTNVTSIHPPTLPPINITPLDIRPVYPPVSHRAGPQQFSTVYEDTTSERTGSFVTAPSVAGDPEDNASPVGGPVNIRGPSGSTTLYSPAFLPGTAPGPFTDSDRSSDPFTTTPPNGSGSGGSSGAQLRPRARGSGTSDTFVLRRFTFGSALSRPSFSAARTATAALARLPPLPILLFWAGFLAPWCWLIGGWLIAEGRWEENGKARAALPLWRRRTTAAAKKDLEKGPDAEPRRRCKWTSWNPFTPRASTLLATVPTTEGEGAAADAAQKEKVVTFVKPYSAEVWVYRCRLAAVISAVMLLTALIVTLVIVGGSSQ